MTLREWDEWQTLDNSLDERKWEHRRNQHKVLVPRGFEFITSRLPSKRRTIRPRLPLSLHAFAHLYNLLLLVNVSMKSLNIHGDFASRSSLSLALWRWPKLRAERGGQRTCPEFTSMVRTRPKSIQTNTHFSSPNSRSSVCPLAVNQLTWIKACW